MVAVPTPKGPPAMDGSEAGWDLSGAEPVWMSTQLAKQLHAPCALARTTTLPPVQPQRYGQRQADQNHQPPDVFLAQAPGEARPGVAAEDRADGHP